MKRILSFIMASFMLAGLLSGCQNKEDAYVPTGDALIMADGQPAKPAQTQQNTDQKLTLTYYPDRPMNPITCTDFTNRTLFSLMYQGLFAIDRDYNPHPFLCKEYTMSQDMRTYTFYLEKATFSDGTPVTAADVAASYQAARTSPYYSGRFQHITSVSAASDGGVTFTLGTAMENLPVLLDIPIVKAAEVAAPNPLGSGPYYLDQGGDSPLLRRNTNWWCQAELLVTAPAISLTAATSTTQIRDTFEFDDLDLVCANPNSDKYSDYRCDYELWDIENGGFLYLSCNMVSEIFSNPEVRAALPTAIDREKIAADNFRGFARSTALPASPLSPYYSQVLADKYAYDQGAAFNQAVANAGMMGKTLTILVNSDDTMRTRIAYSIRDMLAGSGLTVQVNATSGKTYENTLKNRAYDLFLGQTRLSANMDLTPFFSAKGALSYGALNDVAMYTLCLESLANYGNYYTLHKTVMDDGRLCPILFCSYSVYATRGLLTGLTPSRDNVFFYSLGKTMEDALAK